MEKKEVKQDFQSDGNQIVMTAMHENRFTDGLRKRSATPDVQAEAKNEEN